MYKKSNVEDLQVISIDDEVMEFNGRGIWEGAVNVYVAANAIVVTEGVGYTNIVAATNVATAAEIAVVAAIIPN